MSYREPKIIDDKSGLVLGQAIAAGAQNISKGLIAGQDRKEKEEAKAKLEAEKKQAKEDRRIFQTSKAIKDSYADQAAWTKKLEGDLEGLNDFTVQEMSGYMQVSKDLELERINGAYGPDYLKRLEDNQKNIDRVNTFAAGIIGARVDAGAVIDMTEEQRTRDTAFIPITIGGVADNGELAEDAVYAIGGLKGYKIGYDKTKGVRITRPGEDDAYIDIDTWNSISGNLYYHRKDNTTTDMQGLTRDSFYDKDIDGNDVLKPSLTTTTASGIGTNNEIPGTPIEPTPMGINADGYYTSRQNFNNQAVENIKAKVLEATFDKLESFGPYAYKQDLWLKDLERSGFDRVAYNDIGSDDYRANNPNATEADIRAAKKQYINDSAEAQFLSIAQLKKDKDNNYYREIQGRKATRYDLGGAGSVEAAQLITALNQSITAYEEGGELDYQSTVAQGLNNLFGFSGGAMDGAEYQIDTSQPRPYDNLEFTFNGKVPGRLELVMTKGVFEPLTESSRLNKNATYKPINSASQLVNYLNNNVKGLTPVQKGEILTKIKNSYGENFFKGQAPASN
tara:strand:+ start:1816 stop:3507 length:1692 start_codon:yes stop_codon:yes gene_type:complete